jgi:hypothetical protein
MPGAGWWRGISSPGGLPLARAEHLAAAGAKSRRACTKDGITYSNGILTVLEYSSQEAPKVFDSSASSAGANILDPM